MLFDIRVSRSTSNQSSGPSAPVSCTEEGGVTSGPSAPVSCTEEGGSATNFEANDSITTASVASPIAPCPSHAASMSREREREIQTKKNKKSPPDRPTSTHAHHTARIVCGRFPRIWRRHLADLKAHPGRPASVDSEQPFARFASWVNWQLLSPSLAD